MCKIILPTKYECPLITTAVVLFVLGFGLLAVGCVLMNLGCRAESDYRHYSELCDLGLSVACEKMKTACRQDNYMINMGIMSFCFQGFVWIIAATIAWAVEYKDKPRAVGPSMP